MVSTEKLLEEVRRLRAARDLQTDLHVRIIGEQDPSERIKLEKRMHYSRERILRSTHRINTELKKLEDELHGR